MKHTRIISTTDGDCTIGDPIIKFGYGCKIRYVMVQICSICHQCSTRPQCRFEQGENKPVQIHVHFFKSG